MEEMLLQMGGAKDTSAHIFSGEYGTDWTCIFESKSGGSRLRIERTSSSILDAVTQVYNEWSRLTEAVPEFRKALTYTPFEEVPASADDEIPF